MCLKLCCTVADYDIQHTRAARPSSADSRPSRFLEKPPGLKWVTTLEINFDFLMSSASLLSLSIYLRFPARFDVCSQNNRNELWRRKPYNIENLTVFSHSSRFLSFEIDRKMMRMWNKRPRLNGFIFGTRSPKWVRELFVSQWWNHTDSSSISHLIAHTLLSSSSYLD